MWGGQVATSKSKGETVSFKNWTKIDGMTLGKGTWIVVATIGVKGLNQSGAYASLTVGESTSGVVARNSATLHTSTSNTVYISATYLFSIVNDNTVISAYAQANYDATCNSCEMRAIKLAS